MPFIFLYKKFTVTQCSSLRHYPSLGGEGLNVFQYPIFNPLRLNCNHQAMKYPEGKGGGRKEEDMDN